MKKSVILTIFAIYIVAIVAVGFLGPKMKVYGETVYATSIVCDSVEYKPYTEEEKANDVHKFDGYIRLSKIGESVVVICRVLPDNASNVNVSYPTESPWPDKYEFMINEDGHLVVTFKETGTCTLNITSEDKRASLKIKIFVEKSVTDII